jgi:hypothetical protein
MESDVEVIEGMTKCGVSRVALVIKLSNHLCECCYVRPELVLGYDA